MLTNWLFISIYISGLIQWFWQTTALYVTSEQWQPFQEITKLSTTTAIIDHNDDNSAQW